MAPRYHVGSFDDDASYLLAAKALLAGHGVGARLPIADTVAGLFPPGYSALIAPLVWLWPHDFAPERILSALCFAATFPLTWVLAGRWRMSYWQKVAALAILALGPPFATYGSMVMAEAPFLVVLVLLLLAVDSWTSAGASARRAACVVILAAALVWVKQAAAGELAGLVLWLVFRRMWSRAVLVTAGTVLSLVPVLVARLSNGIPLAGSRYSAELGAYYSGGLAGRLRVVLPSSGWHLLSSALPATIVPYLEPLPIAGHWPDLWKPLSWQVTMLAAVGAGAWCRRRWGPAVPMVLVYLLESVLWPYVNERRTILVLPLLVLWYVLGASVVWAEVKRFLPRVPAVAGAGSLATAACFAPLVAQMPRDYLYPWYVTSSRFGDASYIYALRRLGPPAAVVETDYRSATALFSGHPTNWTAFVATSAGLCYEPGVLGLLRADRASYLLLGDFNKPHVLDSPCLLHLALAGGWAVPLLHAPDQDDAWIFALTGAPTGNPRLTSLMPAGQPAVTDGDTTTYLLDPGSRLANVSVALQAGSAAIRAERPDGSWIVMGSGPAPFVDLAAPSERVVAVSVTLSQPLGDPPLVQALGSF